MIWKYKSSNGKCERVWIDELPPVSFEPDAVLRCATAATLDCSKSRFSIAIELFFPGPKGQYALVACKYERDDPQSLESVINYNSSDECSCVSTIDWALSTIGDHVCVGLPLEYARGIEEALNDHNNSDFYPKGRISIIGAAYSKIHSSHLAFYYVTRTLLRIFALPVEQVNDDSLRPILDTWRS